MDDAFVLAFEHSVIHQDDGEEQDVVIQRAFDMIVDDGDDTAHDALDADEEEPWIRYVATTKPFLMNAAKADNICADSTKKVIVQKYPVIVFGSTDKDSTQHFHLLAVMVSKFEKSSDFEYGFNAIKNGILRVCNEIFEPKLLMRDAALAIHNGFIKAFDVDAKSLMCYTHVARAVDRRPIDGNDKPHIKKDLATLRLAYDEKTFETGCRLFLAKWEDIQPDFCDYFNNTWLRQNRNWYNGACNRMVKTNIGIENWNGALKRYHTHWQISGLKGFVVMFFYLQIYFPIEIHSNRFEQV